MTQLEAEYLITRLKEVRALIDSGNLHMAAAKINAEISALTTIKMNLEFTKVAQKLPPYDAPLLIKTKGAVQHITYCFRDGANKSTDLFEPYHFGKQFQDLTLWVFDVEEWAMLPDWRD